MSRRNHEQDDDDYDRPRKSDLETMIKGNVGVDQYSGNLKFFGKEFKVGETAATVLDPVVNWITTVIYQKAGTKSNVWTRQLAKNLHASDAHAAKAAFGAEFLVRVGGPVAQFATDIHRAVKDAYKSMHDMQEETSVLLAANHSNVMTSKFSALEHKRMQVYEKGRREITSSVISAIKQAPALLIGYFQGQLDRVKNPEIAVNERLPSNATEEQKEAVREKFRKLQMAHQVPEEPAADTKARRIEMPDDVADNQLIQSVSWIGNKESRAKFGRSWHNKGSEKDLKHTIQNIGLSPPAVSLGVTALMNHYVDQKKDDPIVAWDLIKDLQDYITAQKHTNIDQVRENVKDIFAQHAKDLGRKYELEGNSYENAADAVANAIVYHKLPAQALAEILDDKKIVVFGRKDADFNELDDVNKQLEAIKEKYVAKTSEKDFYKNTPFTKKDLVNTFNDISPEEKPLFTMLFPPGILEKAGVPKDDVAKYREEGKQHFAVQLNDMVNFILTEGRDELKKQGIKSKYLDEIDAFAKRFNRADRSGDGQEFLKQNQEDTSELVRNIVASAKKPNEMWKEFISRSGGQEQERTERSPMDHASREAGDEMQVGG